MTAASPSPAAADSPEAAYLADSDPHHRRRYAQFFTPWPVASFMARWVLDGEARGRLADPALGLGVFVRAAAAQGGGPRRFTGFELDPAMADRAEAVLAGLPPGVGMEIRRGDFLDSPWEERFDGVLCNPPWLRFQDYGGRAERIRELEERMGLRLGGQANLHSLFLLKALHQTVPGGRLAFAVPWEFLNSGYGRAVKARLLAGGVLRHAVVFDSRARLFPGAVTTACVLLLEAPGGAARGEGAVAFHRAAEGEDLMGLYRARVARDGEGAGTRRLPAAALDPAAKWRGYWQDTSHGGYVGTGTLGDYARAARGIATGRNDFFVLDEAARLAAGLPEECLLPCVARARDASGPVFRPADLAALRAGGRPAWLLDAVGRDHPAVAAYLREGERTGAHLRFLTRHRSPWYALENRPPAPLWVSVFSRGAGPRAVLNLAGARNLTAFHALYPKPGAGGHGAEALAALLFAWLLSPTGRALARTQAREYGEGLEKLEPNDLMAAPVPDLARLGAEAAREAVSLAEALAAGDLDAEAGAARAEAIFRGRW